MSENQLEIEEPDKMVDLVEKILEFNRPNQEGQRQYILTTVPILSGLPISIKNRK